MGENWLRMTLPTGPSGQVRAGAGFRSGVGGSKGRSPLASLEGNHNGGRNVGRENQDASCPSCHVDSGVCLWAQRAQCTAVRRITVQMKGALRSSPSLCSVCALSPPCIVESLSLAGPSAVANAILWARRVLSEALTRAKLVPRSGGSKGAEPPWSPRRGNDPLAGT